MNARALMLLSLAVQLPAISHDFTGYIYLTGYIYQVSS